LLLYILTAIEESGLAEQLCELLRQEDVIVEPVGEPEAFWEDAEKKTFDLLLVSRELVTSGVLERIDDLLASSDAPAIVVLTEYEDDKDRAELIAAGCEAVLNVGLPAEKLAEAIEAILDRRRGATTGIISVPKTQIYAEIGDFVTRSDAMGSFVRVLPRVARSSSSVLILGETGVGKERLAHVLHAESPRSEGPFIAVHCGALPESLMESELFGHEQGAFTGATKARRGCFELAHQGTLFLDEIGEMPSHLQSKLLRVLENREIRRVGGEKYMVVDVRVIAATNRDLQAEVKAGEFRRDLYYRLNVVSLTIPPLRERVEDIPELVDNYIEHLAPRIGCDVSGIADEALEALCDYTWPGNVRELINIIERAMLLCESDTITTDDLPRSIAAPKGLSVQELSQEAEPFSDEWLHKPLKKARQDVLERFERSYLTSLLSATNGRVGEAANQAGIDSRTLFDKMRQYGLRKEDFRSRKSSR
jgi:DNA-binding NtrC family response regulator